MDGVAKLQPVLPTLELFHNKFARRVVISLNSCFVTTINLCKPILKILLKKHTLTFPLTSLFKDYRSS